MPTITPSLDPEDEPPVSESELSQARALTFQNQPLWPLNKETDLLMAHVSRGVDLGRFTAMAFVFIHLQRGGKTFFEDLPKVIGVIWDDPNVFRIEVMKFFADYDASAVEEAVALWMKAYGLKRRTEVQGVPAGGRTKVVGAKKKATTHQKSSGSRSSSRRR
jgi:hypothetical protein